MNKTWKTYIKASGVVSNLQLVSLFRCWSLSCIRLINKFYKPPSITLHHFQVCLDGLFCSRFGSRSRGVAGYVYRCNTRGVSPYLNNIL